MNRLTGRVLMLSAVLVAATPAAAASCEKMLQDYTKAKADRAPLLGENRPPAIVERRDRLTRTMVKLRDEANKQGCVTGPWPAM